jgi:DNA mismatch repair protein MutS2
MEKQNTLNEGDSVRMHGQACIGEVVRITDRRATVAFKSMEANIPLKELEKIPPSAKAKPSTRPIQPPTRMLNLDADAFTAFNPEIDLHGMPVSRALSSIDRWIDRASLLGYQQLKIIHGKGTGTLRSAVHTYLRSHNQVKRVVDKHPYPGGEGVTLLEVD